MGQKFKIKELFKSYSQMLSFLWSLPTKLTSIFDINILGMDQIEFISLDNGMIFQLKNVGVLSFDLSLITDISLWSQYAKMKLMKRFKLFNK
jgi:hypothetical protein